MDHPGKIAISDFSYDLPAGKIASYPLPERDASQLLIYKEGKLAEDIYRNLASYIPPGSLMVFNNTKVVEARLLFIKPSGGQIEIFCLGPVDMDTSSGMLQHGKVRWDCLVGGASKWKPGQVLEKKFAVTGKEEGTLSAAYIEKSNDAFIIELSWTPAALSFAEVLHFAGAIPLPPYIKRSPEESDKERYQTVYARYDGSVAAPTAGLHFTEMVMERIQRRGIRTGFVTLHVGAGTFKPVKTATMEGHEMHAEYIDVSKELIEQVMRNGENKILAVGTTSLRTLESLYWLGVKVNKGLEKGSNGSPELLQWEAYELDHDDIPVKAALGSLLEWMNKNNTDQFVTRTQLLIAPGYRFRIVDGLITNFHQPHSTLLLLVAAFIGEDWKKVYDHALQHDYRFLSFGDGSLLWKKEPGFRVDK